MIEELLEKIRNINDLSQLKELETFVKSKEVEYITLLEKEKILETNEIETPYNFQNTYTITQLAAEVNRLYGTEFNAQSLNQYLRTLGIQEKVGKTWYLTDTYKGYQYTTYLKVVGAQKEHIYTIRWTDVGRRFILDLIKNKNEEK